MIRNLMRRFEKNRVSSSLTCLCEVKSTHIAATISRSIGKVMQSNAISKPKGHEERTKELSSNKSIHFKTLNSYPEPRKYESNTSCSLEAITVVSTDDSNAEADLNAHSCVLYTSICYKILVLKILFVKSTAPFFFVIQYSWLLLSYRVNLI